ncbi:hypothetical protein I6M76_01310 [Citrobacter cronae]|uniref:tail fiber assembly protein n=1 Tax=Citrobacter freundii complex TaxID=1344959 RepID=UPI00190065B7|nr:MULTISPECIES: tail fiber assembly protein [Citrobacter]MBJ8361241.1 hypothetical protein [Citrobacter cronae]MCE9759177.1 tail fiber assembly protein [Citrobacter portucalensis]MCU6184378.1 tail fiber assembly protein [Citrobacter cronae]
MKNYIYSAKNNAFFEISKRSLYDDAGWDLSDAIEVDDDMFNEFTGTPPEGKERVAGDNGFPAWRDAPPPTDEEISQRNLICAQIEYERATVKITRLNEIAEDEDWNETSREEVMEQLKNFTEYRRSLRAYIRNDSGGHDFPILNK